MIRSMIRSMKHSKLAKRGGGVAIQEETASILLAPRKTGLLLEFQLPAHRPVPPRRENVS
jgi:hypothetical protein